jgi:hypothetical protein
MLKIKPDPRYAHIEVNMNVEIGLGGYREARHAVAEINFAGGNIKYIEGPGVLSRIFSFHGNAESMFHLRRELDPDFYDGSPEWSAYFSNVLSRRRAAPEKKPPARQPNDASLRWAADLDKAAARLAASGGPRR